MTTLTKKRTVMIWLLLFITAAAFCAVYFLLVLKVPMGVVWQKKELDLDGHATCQLWGKTFCLKVNSPMDLGDGVSGPKSETLWKSPKGCLVQDFLVSDLDLDGDMELILLVWKRGRYGPDRPFWVEDDEKSYSQHIFIYDVTGDLQVKQKWLASDIGPVVSRFRLMDKNPAIILTEEKSGHCSLWRWESWGLKSIDDSVRLVAFGDNIIHESILEYGMREKAGDFSFLYDPFRKEIQGADIAALNAETILTDSESAYGGYPSFGTPLEVGKAMADAGFDIAACANNHCLDRGMSGIDVSSSFYQENGIVCLGICGRQQEAQPCRYISRNGMTFALFNYTYGTNGIDVSDRWPDAVSYLPADEAGEEKVLADMKAAGEKADAVIVFVHWGEEYSSQITSEQEHFAQLFSRGGADVVIGSHPHVLQEEGQIERADGGTTYVYYSLGNFRADQGMNEETKLGGEAVVVFEHCYDGVKITEHDLKKIDAYWK